MITEYVFENQVYENALIKIKATLMDIVSSEETKLFEIENKFENETNPDIKNKLFLLCNKERNDIREIVRTLGALSKSLENVDSCSKEFSSIEDENIAQILANVEKSYIEPEIVNKEVIEETPQVIEEPVVQEENITSSEESKEKAQPVTEVQETETPVIENKEVVEETPQIIEEPIVQAENITSSEESKEEAQPVTEAQETEVPVVENKEVVEETPQIIEEPIVQEENITSSEESKEEAQPVTEAQETEVPVVENKEVVEETPQIIEEPIVQEENITSAEESKEEAQPVTEAQETETPVIENKEVVEETPQINKNPNEISLPIISTNELNSESISLTQAEQSSEQDNQAVSTDASTEIPVVEQTNNIIQEPSVPSEMTSQLNDSNKEEQIVKPENIESPQQQEPIKNELQTNEPSANNTTGLTFQKSTNDEVKAILISAQQGQKLRMSYSTQEALLNARGTIASRNITGVSDDVQTLVDNGTIEPSPENIESLMEKANALYREGKKDEAQAMYDKISELNKQMQQMNNSDNKVLKM